MSATSSQRPTDKLRVAVTLEQCWHRVPGGVGRAALESVRAVQALTAPDGGPRVEQVGVAAAHRRPPPEPWRPPIPVRHLPLPRPLLYEAWHSLRRPRVESATGAVDVVHATGMAVPGTRAPMVVTVHDLAFLRNPAHSTRRGLRFFRRSVEMARLHADLVVVPSQATLEDCLAHGFEEERLRLVPWGVEVMEPPSGAVASTLRRLGIDGPYVLWVGTVEPRKNLPALIEAWQDLDSGDTRLVLAGPDGWNEDLHGVSARLGGRVACLGMQSREDLRALYAGSVAFCLPSIEEGFGLPVLEAMAQGAPVVTSSGTATAEVAGDAALLVDPRDVGALAEALERVLGDDALRARLSEAGRARAEQFPWSRTATGLVSAYRELAR